MVAGKARFRSKKGRAAMGAVFTHDATENGITPNDYENTCIPVSSSTEDGERTGDRDHLNESILFRPGGTPVCEIVGQSCDIDTEALTDHLGMYPTNPCDEDAKSVTVYHPPIGSNDCDCGVTSGNVIDDCDDPNPGNGVCELPPGSYDRIKVEKGGRLRFLVDGEENEFIACQVSLGKNSITATDPGVVIHTGDFNVDHVGCFGLQELCEYGDWVPPGHGPV